MQINNQTSYLNKNIKPNSSFGVSGKVIVSDNIEQLGGKTALDVQRAVTRIKIYVHGAYDLAIKAMPHLTKDGHETALVIDVREKSSPVKKLLSGLMDLLGFADKTQRKIVIPQSDISKNNVLKQVTQAMRDIQDNKYAKKLMRKLSTHQVGVFTNTTVATNVPEYLGGISTGKVIKGAKLLDDKARDLGYSVKLSSQPEGRVLHVSVSKDGTTGIESINADKTHGFDNPHKLKEIMLDAFDKAVVTQQENATYQTIAKQLKMLRG